MHLGMSYRDVKSLPTSYRRWYIQRLSKHFKDQKDRINKSDNASTISTNQIDKYKGMIDQKFSTW